MLLCSMATESGNTGQHIINDSFDDIQHMVWWLNFCINLARPNWYLVKHQFRCFCKHIFKMGLKFKSADFEYSWLPSIMLNGPCQISWRPLRGKDWALKEKFCFQTVFKLKLPYQLFLGSLTGSANFRLASAHSHTSWFCKINQSPSPFPLSAHHPTYTPTHTLCFYWFYCYGEAWYSWWSTLFSNFIAIL